jgi:hypothetical protein
LFDTEKTEDLKRIFENGGDNILRGGCSKRMEKIA